MKCKNCETDLFIEFSEELSDVIIKCHNCNETYIKDDFSVAEILEIVKVGNYSDEVRMKSFDDRYSGYILYLVSKHVIHQFLSKYSK